MMWTLLSVLLVLAPLGLVWLLAAASDDDVADYSDDSEDQDPRPGRRQPPW